jgi:imidazolonepropionase
MTPAEAITASTINAASSLNLGDTIGSLERGKLADLVVHDCDDYRELAYFFGIEHAWKTFASGVEIITR